MMKVICMMSVPQCDKLQLGEASLDSGNGAGKEFKKIQFSAIVAPLELRSPFSCFSLKIEMTRDLIMNLHIS